MQIKACKVLINNAAVTVVDFDGIQVQLPAIGEDAKTVWVECDDGKYTMVNEVFQTALTVEIEDEAPEKVEEAKPVKKSRKKKPAEK